MLLRFNAIADDQHFDTNFYMHHTSMASKIKRTGKESLVTINLTLRTRNPYGINKQFKKKDYHGGNFKFDKNDKYKRETFSSKVFTNLIIEEMVLLKDSRP